MWRKYSARSVEPPLRSVAVYALGQYSGFKDLAVAVLAEQGDDSFVKQSVLASLEHYEPDITTSVILETRWFWQDDKSLQERAIALLSRDATDKVSRSILYQWFHDGSLAPRMRLSVFEALTSYPQARDVLEYKKLIDRQNVPEPLGQRLIDYLEEEAHGVDAQTVVAMKLNQAVRSLFPESLLEEDPVFHAVLLCTSDESIPRPLAGCHNRRYT